MRLPRVVSDQTTTELVGLVLVEFRVCRCRVDRVLLWTSGEHEQVLRASLDRRGELRKVVCAPGRRIRLRGWLLPSASC
jgi:hypothetical protein